MKDVIVTILVAVASVLGGGGIVTLINALARKKLTKVDVAEKVNELTLEWATAMKADAEEARHDAAEARHESAEARREATECHRQISAVRREATALAEDLHRLRQAVLAPDATLARLRALVHTGSES